MIYNKIVILPIFGIVMRFWNRKFSKTISLMSFVPLDFKISISTFWKFFEFLITVLII